MKRPLAVTLAGLLAASLALPAAQAAPPARKRQQTCVVVTKRSAAAAERAALRSASGARRAQASAARSRTLRCVGARGPRGTRGPTGPKGADGSNGRDGANGRDGSDGATGPAGPSGSTGPQGPAGSVPTTAFARVAAAVTTDSITFVDLGGPSVGVTVPASGTIQVAASSEAADGDGAVSLYEDGVQLPGQAADLVCGGPAGTLFDTDGSFAAGPFGTPGAYTFGLCATLGAPGPVLFETTPGPHRYELRYAYSDCGCGIEATFLNRRLWVTPVP